MPKHPDTAICFDKQWWLSVTEKCNWKCWYCDFPEKCHHKTASIEQLNKFISNMNGIIHDNNIELCIEGGEIGLVEETFLDAFFNSNLDISYTVTTNGEFLKRGYHHKYVDKIHYILYHVVSDLADDNVIVDDYNVDKSIRLDCTIVIHKNNIKYIDKFLDRNCDYMFLPHLMQPRKPGLNFLSIYDFKEIRDILKDKSNIHGFFKDRLDTIIRYLSGDESILTQMRNECANIYHKPIIDLPNNVIRRCCITIDNCDAVELNRENLIRLDNNDITLFPITDKICDGCIANFLWHDNIEYLFKNKRMTEAIKFMRKLNNYDLFRAYYHKSM